MVQACDLSPWEEEARGSRDPGHPWLHIELEASLGLRPCFKNKQKPNQITRMEPSTCSSQKWVTYILFPSLSPTSDPYSQYDNQVLAECPRLHSQSHVGWFCSLLTMKSCPKFQFPHLQSQVAQVGPSSRLLESTTGHVQTDVCWLGQDEVISSGEEIYNKLFHCCKLSLNHKRLLIPAFVCSTFPRYGKSLRDKMKTCCYGVT